MRVPRFAAHVVAIVVIAVLVTPAVAQEWPSGTVRVVVPYAAGGPVDVPARLLIERLAAQTKGVFILENRPGAGGSIGLQAVVQAAPDGGTLLLTTSSVTMVPTIYPKLAFDPLRDLTSISLVTEVPISLAVRAASPFRDLADLIARAKAEPGKYTFGSGGVGTGNHLAGELLKKLAGIDLLHVPFRGVAPALTALYAGDIDMLFASTVETVSHARDRRIRVLGVGSPQPIPELPELPGHRRPGAGLCRDQLVRPVRAARPAGRRADAVASGTAEGGRRCGPEGEGCGAWNDDDVAASRRATRPNGSRGAALEADHSGYRAQG